MTGAGWWMLGCVFVFARWALMDACWVLGGRGSQSYGTAKHYSVLRVCKLAMCSPAAVHHCT